MTTFAETLTFGDLINEVIGLRFSSAQQTQAAHWIQLAYAHLWGLEDWTFRFTRADVAVTASSDAPTMPSDFGIPQGVFLSTGGRLSYVGVGEFYERFADQPTGTPTHYTVIAGDQLVLGPIPNANLTLRVPYERRPTPLTDDTSVPSLPTGHHYSLVFGALAMGLPLYNDFTAEFMTQKWSECIDALRRDYLAKTRGESHQLAPYRPGLGLR